MNFWKSIKNYFDLSMPADPQKEFLDKEIKLSSTPTEHLISIAMPPEDAANTTITVRDGLIYVIIKKKIGDVVEEWKYKIGPPANSDPSTTQATYKDGELLLSIRKLHEDHNVEIEVL
jgi:hypothetical protein